MKYIRLILEIFANFFKWRVQATDPEKDFQEKYDKWQQKLQQLERDRDEAKEAWRLVAIGVNTGNRDKLWAECISKAKAIGHHRAREPKRKVCRS